MQLRFAAWLNPMPFLRQRNLYASEYIKGRIAVAVPSSSGESVVLEEERVRLGRPDGKR